MENRSLALRCLSDALNMDSVGNSQAAFAKYLQSLHVLTLYLNELFSSLGFQKVLEKNKEIKQVLCMIHECSDRITAILNNGRKSPHSVSSLTESSNKSNAVNSIEVFTPKKFPAFEKLQSENLSLLKRFQWRLERAPNDYAKTNLRLELERQLIQNEKIAKEKFDLAVKDLQKERVHLMENEMRKLLGKKQNLSDKQKEKQELYLSVLQYAKTESWPCTWELSSMQMTAPEAAKQVFQQTVRCSGHPLSQWLLVMQTNIKREIDTFVKQHSDLQSLLPSGRLLNSENDCLTFNESSTELVIESSLTGRITISKSSLAPLQGFLANTSAEILSTIANVLDIFYLIYKSLLPEDSEEICHRLIETHILGPIWPNLIVLYRISNLSSEYKTLETMVAHRDSDPSQFGFSSLHRMDPSVSKSCVSMLRSLALSHSMTDKLRIFVEIAQLLCGNGGANQSGRTKLGADDLIPLLCYVIIKSGLPQLSSECCAIEQLFDMKYMFGEEGYALCSFLTALKFIEIRKVLDNDGTEKIQANPDSSIGLSNTANNT